MENNNRMTFHITGGQVNIASDNATIHATQNNGMSEKELDSIVEAIKGELSGLSKEESEEIKHVVDMAKEELKKPEPKVSELRKWITLIAPMFTITNGIPTLTNNLQKLCDMMMQYIK